MGRSGGGSHIGRSHLHTHKHKNRRHTNNRSDNENNEQHNENSEAVVKGVVCLASTAIIIILIVVIPIVVYDVSLDTLDEIELSPQEQYIWCGDKKIEFEYSASNIKVYESMNGEPGISNKTRSINATISIGFFGSYKYKSFFLAPGSRLSGNKSSSSADFIVIKGWKQMKKYIDHHHYDYIIKGSSSNFSLDIEVFGEYFVVLDNFISGAAANIYATLALYNTGNLTQTCASSQKKKCVLNDEKNKNFCVVIDYNADDSHENEEITIKDSDSNKVGGASIAAISIGCFLIIVVIAIAVWLVTDEKREMNERELDMATFTPAEIVDVNGTADPELQPSGTDVSYPAVSPSNIPTSIPGQSDANYGQPPPYRDDDGVDINQYPSAPPPPPMGY